MNKEFELKYRIKEPSAETINEFLTIDKLNNYTLENPERKEYVDVYYDTRDYKISKAKSILRIRVENFHIFLITIKTTLENETGNNAIFEREEFENTVSEELVEEVHGKLKNFNLELKDFDRNDYMNYGIWGMFKMWGLKEIFVCENSRNVRNITEDGNLIAELCVDEVLISTFGRKEKFNEIEIEAKNENKDKVIKLSDFINQNFKNKLETGSQSKYETGMRLLYGKTIYE